MRGKKLAGIVAAPFLAVALAVSAGASMSDHNDGVRADQHGSNNNGTEQEAKTWSETQQANVNAPFTKGDDHGKRYDKDHGKGYGKDKKDFDHKDKGNRHESSDVDQYNDAETKAKSENENGTKQNLDQEQNIWVVNRYEPKHDKPDYSHGDKDHGKDHNGYGHKGHDSKGHDSGSIDAKQDGNNENWTDQKAKSEATTEQANINAPFGGGNGDVDQSNSADTKAKSSNDNWTEQNLDQNQDIWSGSGYGKGYGDKGSGDVEATQTGSNDNWTSQDAESKASTQQVNIYAPITVFGSEYRSGDVNQSNDANTTASSSNDNYTKQDLDQDQTVKSSGNGDVKAEQSGTNSNGTEQASSSKAETQQVNIYAPISVYSHGGSGGDVNQGNTADTNASSSNGNGTGQFAGQDQAAA